MRILIIFILVIIFTLYPIPYTLYPIYAQELSFSLSPQLVELAPEIPGPLLTPIMLINNSEQKQLFTIKIIPFEADGNSGQVSFLNIELPIKDNVAVLDNDIPITQITLRPKESKILTLYILAPENPQDGDYYFSVVFLPKIDGPTDIKRGDDQIQAYSKIRAGLATNVLLSLGKAKNQQPHLKIVKLATENFIEHGPLPITVEIANQGKHFAKVDGQILITNLFGEVIAKLEIPAQNILAQSSRLYPTVVLADKFLIGSYSIKLNLDLPAQGNRHTTFFALPYQRFFGIAIAVIVLLLIKKRVDKRIRRQR